MTNKIENQQICGSTKLRQHMSESTFMEKLSKVPNEYRPVPFWFLNHYLREDELRKQIREMAEKGFGGIMLHGRDGLRSGYLNPEWRKAVAWCIDEAVTLGLEVWLYDELNYPSGPVDGKIFDYFPDADMKCLAVVLERQARAGEAVAADIAAEAIFSFAILADGSVLDVRSSVTSKGELRWVNTSGQPATVIALAPRRDPSKYKLFPDYLDKKAMEKFVDLTYEWYAKEFGNYFGSVIKGEFTDNSCVSFGYVRRSIPWSADIPERFKQHTGKDIADILPGVFLNTPRCKEDRLAFWRFINAAYLETFIKPIDDSCRKNGIASTGHYCIEEGSSEHIRQLGDRFDQKRNQGLPAVDMLGTDDPDHMSDLLRMRHRDSLSVSIPGTACPAYFTHNSRVMCECMGLACGWKLDLAEIRRATGLLAVLGVDIFVPHGLYYSIAGHRKWESIPDHYHNPMWEFYDEWTKWISKISYLTSHSERTSETALLYPVTTQQAHIELGATQKAGGGHPTSDRGTVCDLTDLSFRAAGNLLLENNIPYEIIDERYIQQASLDGDRLLLAAANGKPVAFKALLLPNTSILEAKTLEKLAKWRHSGGKVIALNSPPEQSYHPESGRLMTIDPNDAVHCAHIGFDSEAELAQRKETVLSLIREKISNKLQLSGAAGKIVSREWRKWGLDFCMLHNISREAVNAVTVKWLGTDIPLQLDLESDMLRNIVEKRHDDSCSFTCDFHPAQTLVLVAGNDLSASPWEPRATHQKIIESFKIEGEWSFKTHKPNALPLRSCEMQIARGLHRHVFHFNIGGAIPQSIGVALEPEMLPQELLFDEYFDRMKCFVNGIRIKNFRPGTVFDRWIREADIQGAVRKGENELVVEISAGLLEENRRVESPILFGAFSVLEKDGGAMLAAPSDSLPVGDWRLLGYPHYSGMASYQKSVKLPVGFKGRQLTLRLGHVANAAEVIINGSSCGRRISSPWDFDISAHNTADVLAVELRVINTAQNLWDANTLPSGVFDPVEIHALA